MDNEKELRAMFGLPEMKRQVADNIGLEIDEFIDVELPVKRKYKPRGKSWTSEDNPQYSRWKCLECGMITNASCLSRHQRVQSHKGKQRVFPELEKLGIV